MFPLPLNAISRYCALNNIKWDFLVSMTLENVGTSILFRLLLPRSGVSEVVDVPGEMGNKNSRGHRLHMDGDELKETNGVSE